VIRAFIAVEIDPQVIGNICRAIHQLESTSLSARWTAPANIHLTLKFLGDIEPDRIDGIHRALEERLRPFPRCTINAKGLGVFPDPRRPRIIWVGIHGDQLASLAAQVESALVPSGFAPDQRNFSPHLTIGRWRQTDRPPKALAQELAKWKDVQFGATRVDEVVLFRSVLKPEGATYYRLIGVALGRGAVEA
jgi:2'-5' RNA ligase